MLNIHSIVNFYFIFRLVKKNYRFVFITKIKKSLLDLVGIEMINTI